MESLLNATVGLLGTSREAIDERRDALSGFLWSAYDYGVIVYVHPQHVGHVLVSCVSFFFISACG